MTRDSELGVSGRRKENAQKIAMSSKGGNQLGLPAQWYRVVGENTAMTGEVAGKSVIGTEVSVSTRMKRMFRRGCRYW